MATLVRGGVQRQRNYGIDLLRMVSMFLILVLHVLGHGGILTSADPQSFRYWMAWFLEAAAYCSVNCYALISGYVGYNARYRYSSLAVLWLRVVFYTVGIPAAFAICGTYTFNLKTLLQALMPVMTGNYWYFTHYFFLFFLFPIFNLALAKFSHRQMRATLIGLLALYSFGQSVRQVSVYGNGYDFIWLGILYLVGGYIAKYDTLKNVSGWKAVAGYLVMVTGAWLSQMGSEWVTRRWKTDFFDVGLVSYFSPFVFGEAVCLLLLFRGLRLGDVWIWLVKKMAPLTFSVYLIHVNKPLIWNGLLEMRFASYISLPLPLFLPAVLSTALGIYVICSLLDLPREYLFKVLHLRQSLDQLETRLLGDLWQCNQKMA